MAENTVPNANIGDYPVVAMDVDSDDTADTLTYTLGGTHADSFGIVMWRVRMDGGQLQTKAALDYETQSDYEVMVTATDTGWHSLRYNHGHVSTLPNLSPTDGDTAVANSAPYFLLNPTGPSTTRSVAENTAAKDEKHRRGHGDSEW